MATPVLQDLKETFPKARLMALCKRPLHTLLENNPFVDEIWSFTQPQEAVFKMRKTLCDVGILLTNSLSSTWMFVRGKVRTRIGFQRGIRTLFLTHALSMPKQPEHLVTTYKRVLEPLGIFHSSSLPRMVVTKEEAARAEDMLRAYPKPVIGIHPVATYGPAKCWPAERFRKVTEELLRSRSCTILYVGNADAKETIGNIVAEFPSHVVNMAGKTTMRELASLLQKCSLLLTNDSGPMHLADALDVPVVALFGSTCDIRTGPYRRNGVMIHKRVTCSPCFRRTCPIDFRCMNEISVEEVLHAVEQHLV